MNQLIVRGLTLCLLIVCLGMAQEPDPLALPDEPDLEADGFISLFNGEDLAGWTVANPRPGGTYEVVDGAIVGTAENCRGNTFLRTARSYSDFIFTCEVRFEIKGNSGIQFRSNQRRPGEGGAKDGRVYGYQCEYDHYRGDKVEDRQRFTGGIYGEGGFGGWVAPIPEDRSLDVYQSVIAHDEDGGWDRVTIRCRGNHIETWVNGLPATNWIDERPEARAEGFFALQVHGGKAGRIHWRNLRVMELDGE